MPSKYVVRNFSENSYYHIFNRGVEKRNIFLDETDYRTFLYYLFAYLRPLEEAIEKYPDLPIRLINKNLFDEIELLAYCLMPNHFHFLLKQKTETAIPRLLKQITNAYTFYFNERYDRIGGLMQGRYKSVEVVKDDLFIHLARYIHLNPIMANVTQTPEEHRWSSYPDYLGKKAEVPAAKEKILSYFPSVGAFKGFHEDREDYNKGLDRIKHIAIDHGE